MELFSSSCFHDLLSEITNMRVAMRQPNIHRYLSICRFTSSIQVHVSTPRDVSKLLLLHCSQLKIGPGISNFVCIGGFAFISMRSWSISYIMHIGIAVDGLAMIIFALALLACYKFKFKFLIPVIQK